MEDHLVQLDEGSWALPLLTETLTSTYWGHTSRSDLASLSTWGKSKNPSQIFVGGSSGVASDPSCFQKDKAELYMYMHIFANVIWYI